MSNQITDADRALLGALEVDATSKKVRKYTAREERVIAGFEDIQRWVEEHGREPLHGAERDIFERLYAVRLERIREQEEYRALLAEFDAEGLAAKPATRPALPADDLSDEALLAELGVERDPEDDITNLKHVRSREEIRAAEEVAQRNPCEDFDRWRPVFEAVQSDLDAGLRRVEQLQNKLTADIRLGNLYILEGQKALVAEVGRTFKNDYGRKDAKLRVVYDNGTESDLLLRSLQRALHRDEQSRRITEAGVPTLFSDEAAEDDTESGTIYVLRSESAHPVVAEYRQVIHKIGVTGGDVASRIANAAKDPTYLLAGVEVVASYRLANVDRVKLERLLQRFFAEARLDLALPDRFGQEVRPREWFLVPLPAIEEAIERIMDGTLGGYGYDVGGARLVGG